FCYAAAMTTTSAIGSCRHGSSITKDAGQARRLFTMAAWQGLAGQLLFLDLRQFLAVNAQFGGGARFQATNADFDAARFTEAVLVLVDHVDGLLDFLEQLTLAITGAQFQCELFFLGGAVVRVRQVGGLVLQMVDGAIRLLQD